MKIHTRTVPAPHRVGVPATLFAFLLLASPCATGTDENPNPEPYPPTVIPPPTSPCNGPCESDCDSGSCGAESSCSEAGSVFFSLDLGRARFERKTDLFRNAIVAGSNPALPSIAHRNRDFKSLNQFYRKSPLTGMRQFKLWISAEKMTWPIYYRSAIQVDQETNAEIISDGGIRQILTFDRFVDIQSLEDVLTELEEFSEDIYDLITDYMPEGYVIRTWQAGTQGTKSGNYYPLPESDPLSWTIIYNPDEYLDEHRLAIIHMKVFDDSLAYKTESYLHEDERNGQNKPVRWTLDKFDGLPIGGPIEVVDLLYDQQNYVNELKFTRVRTVSRPGQNGGILGTTLGEVEKVFEKYDDIGGLSRLVEKIDAYGTAAARETLYGWHNTPSDTHTHGLPRYVVYPDGSYEHHTYSFNVAGKTGTVTRRTPWNNNTWAPSGTPPADSTCVKELTTFETANKIVTVRSIDTQTIARTTEEWAAESGDLVFIETQRYDADNDLVTKTGYYPSTAAAHLANRIKWRELPDGTAETYHYEEPNGSGDYEQTVKRGAGSRSGITAGTMVKSTRNTHGVTVIEETYEFGPFGSFQMESWSATQESVFGRIKKKTWINDHDYEETAYSCCGIEWHRDRRGVRTNYHRDSLKRTWKTVRTEGSNVITTTTAHTFGILGTLENQPMLIEETHRSDGTNNLLVSKSWRNLVGETIQIHHPDQNGDTAAEPTEYEYDYPSVGGRVVSIKYPDNSTEITAYMADGNIASRTGTAVNNTRYDYDFHTEKGGGLWTRTIALDENGADTDETVTSYHDPAGRVFRTQFNSMIANGSTNDAILHTYFATHSRVPAGRRGQRSSTTDPDGVATSFTYDSQGRLFETIEPMPVGTSTTRTTKREYTAANVSGVGYARIITTKVNNVIVSEDIHAGHGYASRNIQNQSRVTTTIRSAPNDLTPAHTWHETTTHPDGTFTRNYFVEGSLAATTRWASDISLINIPASAPADITDVSIAGFIEGQSYLYDVFGRMLESTNSRTGTTQYTSYTESGNLLTRIAPGGIVPGDRTTTYAYDKMGRGIKVDQPDTPIFGSTVLCPNVTHTSYTLKGEVRAVWGDQTNPTFRVYDEQGRMTELHTWRAAPSPVLSHSTTTPPGASALTWWIYHPYRGWIVEKNHHGENDDPTAEPAVGNADYTYTAAGRLKFRTWQRGVITEYGYQHGILKTVEYSGEPGESTTADIVYSYDIFGRVRTVTQGDINTHTYSYKDDLHDDDDDSETDDVPYGTGFGLHSETVNYGTGAPARTIIRHEDDIQRPSGWQLKDVGTVEHAVAYGYDTAGRTRHVHPAYPLPGSPDFTYHYEDDSFHLLSSVVGPAHTVFNVWDSTRDVLDTKFNTASVVSNTLLSSFHYTVNDIGQRTAVAPAPVPNSIPAEFPAYEIAWTWGYNARGEVVSADHGSDTEANAEDRFYRFDAIGNRDYIRNGVHADSGGTQVNYTANELNQYTGNDQNFIHDLDGNLEEGAMRYDALSDKDGTSYTATLLWDAENRLVGILDDETVMVAYRYDYLGRRISRTAGGTTTWYFYDGWNPIAEYAGTTHSKSYTWGIDFSGTMQGAGGIGGLLAARHESATGKPSFYPAYDGNGNVTEYLDKDGEVEVRFEYDPFGRLVVSTDANGAFPIRFSTKMLEDKTGLYYYGYRWYDPVTGRWPSRDPIGERGGVNLYGFVGNNGVNWVDILGLSAGETITVEKCTAYLIIDHGSKTNPIKWKFPDGCAVGGAAVCFPASNNNVPQQNRWPKLPNHNNKLVVPDAVAGTRRGDVTKDKWNDMFNDRNDPNFDEPHEYEHSFDEVVRNLMSPDALNNIRERLCKCCDEITLTVDFRWDREGSNDGRFGFGKGKSTDPHKQNFTLRCPNK